MELVLRATLFMFGTSVIGISLAAAGYPHPFFVAMTLIEFMLPPFVICLTAVVPARGRQPGPAFASLPQRALTEGS
jgi:hypothetical protein